MPGNANIAASFATALVRVWTLAWSYWGAIRPDAGRLAEEILTECPVYATRTWMRVPSFARLTPKTFSNGGPATGLDFVKGESRPIPERGRGSSYKDAIRANSSTDGNTRPTFEW